MVQKKEICIGSHTHPAPDIPAIALNCEEQSLRFARRSDLLPQTVSLVDI